MAYFGLSAKNEEQKAALRALASPKPFTFITGPAGTGKTLLAMAVGLEGVIEQRDYDKMIYTRMQTQIDEQLGALPGNIDEKTFPFIAPFMDNLEVLSENPAALKAYFAIAGTDDTKKPTRNQKIFFDPLQTMRGRSVNGYIISDESQNLGCDIIHALGTRPRVGQKIVFVGNFAQIDKAGLRKPENNGLYRLLSGLYEREAHAYFDHVNLTEVHRDPIVEIVEDIFRDKNMHPAFKALEMRGNLGEALL